MILILSIHIISYCVFKKFKSPKVLKILNTINPTTNIGRNFIKLVLKSIFVSFINFNVSNGINNIKKEFLNNFVAIAEFKAFSELNVSS